MPFEPKKSTIPRERRNIKIELDPDYYARIQTLATSRGVTLKDFVRQALDYAVSEMPDQENN